MWRACSIVLVIAVLGVVADAESKKKKLGKGFWKVLVQPKAKWVLRNQLQKDETLTVETYDVRAIGKAQVARLRWTLKRGPDGDPDIEALKYTHAIGLTQIAVTDAGAYLMWAAWDDAKVGEELKKPPSRSDPPKPYKGTKVNEGRYLEIDGDVVCMGQNPPPGEPCDGCDGGSVCISATDGIVSIENKWAPGQGSFAK